MPEPQPLTVRQVVEEAFGPVPEGATVHVAHPDTYDKDPAYQLPGTNDWRCFGPDISDRPASSFIGFFGEDFDRVARGEE